MAGGVRRRATRRSAPRFSSRAWHRGSGPENRPIHAKGLADRRPAEL